MTLRRYNGFIVDLRGGVNQGDIIKQKAAGSILSSRMNIAIKFVKYYT